MEAYYVFDAEKLEAQKKAKPWKSDPHHFKRARISAVAVLKMVLHANSTARGPVKTEVMGIMVGKYEGDCIYVMDCFALPIQGEEAFVTSQDAANVYMANFVTMLKRERGELAIGWYHSHPGLKVFLSGTDCGTQRTYQTFFDPWLAVVIDPVRTVTTGKIDLGAFRVWPAGYTAPGASAASSGWEAVPADKIEEFGVHADAYYKLETTFFKSRADDRVLASLWEEYWVASLSANPLVSNRDYFVAQLAGTSKKIEAADAEIGQSGRMRTGRMRTGAAGASGAARTTALTAVASEAASTSIEQLHALMNQVVKAALFNGLE
eukprot:c11028_g1_i1.p1 GENE.c11028_g1_i1~~c11028_g1_i1.p1  ORF type:complete len:362 (-),score=68.61 c11028_g1_i1:22-984(-)